MASYFSTDTATALRAIEIEADAILLAKSIDGVYDSDPAVNKDAVKYDSITMEEVLDHQEKNNYKKKDLFQDRKDPFTFVDFLYFLKLLPSLSYSYEKDLQPHSLNVI